METFLDFLLCRRTHVHNFALEIQRLAGHRVIHVDLDCLCFHLQDFCRNWLPELVHESDVRAFNEQIVPHFSLLVGKCLHRKVDNPLWVNDSISLFRSERKFKLVPGLKSGYLLLKLRQKVSHSVNEVQRPLHSTFVNNLPINLKLVCESHHSVLFYFHIFLI